MKIFIVRVARRQLVKMLMGFAALSFGIRIVAGLTDEAEILGISIAGYQEFTWVMLLASAVLLLWDLRDNLASIRVR